MKEATSAVWVEREPDVWGLYLQYPGEELRAYRPRALVRPSKGREGEWFWEHWPFMGEFGTANTVEDAKEIAGAPWEDIISLWFIRLGKPFPITR